MILPSPKTPGGGGETWSYFQFFSARSHNLSEDNPRYKACYAAKSDFTLELVVTLDLVQQIPGYFSILFGQDRHYFGLRPSKE